MIEEVTFNLAYDYEDLNNAAGSPFSIPGYSHLGPFQIPNNIVLKSNRQLTDWYRNKRDILVFYPIHPISLTALAMPPGKELETPSDMGSYFSPVALSLLQDPRNKFMLLIDYRFEGWDLEKPHNPDQIIFFHSFINRYKIPANKIFFVHGNLNNDSSIYDNLPIDRNNICNVNIFESITSGHINRTYTHNFTIEEKNYQTVSKKFVCKNNIPHGHRLFIIDWLNRQNALKDIYWSLAGVKFKETLLQYHPMLLQYYYKDEHDTSLAVERTLKLLENGPVQIDWPTYEVNVGNIAEDVQPKSYLDSCFSLVTETCFDERNTKLLFLTEKTFKPISTLHPFLIVGAYKTLDYLKELGYHTFPELFDESYDNLPKYKDRMNVILKNLTKVLKTPTLLLAKEFSTYSINKKLIENQERLKDAGNYPNNTYNNEYGKFIKKQVDKYQKIL